MSMNPRGPESLFPRNDLLRVIPGSVLEKPITEGIIVKIRVKGRTVKKTIEGKEQTVVMGRMGRFLDEPKIRIIERKDIVQGLAVRAIEHYRERLRDEDSGQIASRLHDIRQFCLGETVEGMSIPSASTAIVLPEEYRSISTISTVFEFSSSEDRIFYRALAVGTGPRERIENSAVTYKYPEISISFS